MKSVYYFVLAESASGRLYIGRALHGVIEEWKSGKKLSLEDPRCLHPLPSETGQGVQLTVIPTSMVETKQAEIFLDPVMVEVIGEIKDDSCPPAGRLFGAYVGAIKEWKMNQSGLEMPTALDLKLINNPTEH